MARMMGVSQSTVSGRTTERVSRLGLQPYADYATSTAQLSYQQTLNAFSFGEKLQRNIPNWTVRIRCVDHSYA